jgi:hypothetical protein
MGLIRGIGKAVASPVRGVRSFNKASSSAYANSRVANSQFMASHSRTSSAARFASRHPISSAVVAGGVVGGVGGPMGGGPRTSRTNQNDYYLRQMRSSATQGLIPRSIGGMTG